MAYETDTDRINEERVANEWAALRGCKAIAIAAEHPRIDRALIGATGSLVGFAEVKSCGWRFGEPSFGGGYKLETAKDSAAVEARFAFSLPVFLVVEFVDALAWLDITTAVRNRGYRLKRRDRGTEVNAVLFAWQEFKIDRMVSEPSIALALPHAEFDPAQPPNG